MPSIKDEFHYISSVFICGEKSPRNNQYKVYNLDIFKKHKDLAIRINKIKNREERSISFSECTELSTCVVKGSYTGSYANLVSYIDATNLVNISDTIFTNDEFGLYGSNIGSLIERKIYALAKLIESFYKKDLSKTPLLLSDFPNICKLLLDKSHLILK